MAAALRPRQPEQATRQPLSTIRIKGDAMPGPVQAPQTRYISLDTDFGYDALGGMGRLGRHSM